jgi:alkylation response protein AidB-like acyl-CoA dehydrogenase
VLGAGLINHAGSDQQKNQLLPAIAAGELKLALAQDEAASRYNMRHVETQAVASDDGWLLTGQKSVVLGGSSADKFIVSARTAGQASDANGVSLFLVDASADGVELKSYTNYDGQRAADIAFNGVSLTQDALLGEENKGLAVLAFGSDLAIAALCAEAVGIMDSLIEQTGEYLKTRKQFGVALGSFQALQHRMADMLMHAEQARSMSYLAASKVAAPAKERTRIMAATKALTGQAARFVGQQAVQLHGGIGVTDELIISHYFKRLTLINTSFGDADYHLGRFSDMSAAQAMESFATV